MKRWGKRFLASTRGQVVQRLRHGKATVNELAAALGLTDNAIRAHLNTLERDGLVEQAGKRAGVRKPESVYALTQDAEQLFPKAYHLLLGQLLSVLSRRLSPAEIEEVLQEVGRNLAAGQASTYEGKGFRERVEEALNVLGGMGGLAELQERQGQFVIQGCSCPLGAAVREHPEVCRLAEALLAEIIGVPVQEMCERDGTPRCVFHIERQN